MSRHLPIAPFLLASGLAHASLYWVWQAEPEPSVSEQAGVVWMNVNSRFSNGEAPKLVDAEAQSLAAVHFSHLEEPLAKSTEAPKPQQQRDASAQSPAKDTKRTPEPIRPIKLARAQRLNEPAETAEQRNQSRAKNSGRKTESGQAKNSLKPALSQVQAVVERSSLQPLKGVFASLRSMSPAVASAAQTEAQARGNGSKAGETLDFAPLMAALRAKVEDGKRYPRLSRARGEEGVAEISFQLKPNGSVESLAVKQSSSHPRLDREALRAVEQVEPFPLAGDFLTQPKQFSIKLSFVLR